MKAIIAAILSSFLVFGGTFTASAAVDTAELQTYLSEVQLTQQQLEDYLATFGLVIEDYESVEELRDELGPRATTETINQLLEDYQMTLEELEALLMEYDELEAGKTIEETFLFIIDVEDIILLDSDEDFGDIDEDIFEEIESLFSEMGITEQELMNLFTHIETVIANDPTIEAKLDALSERMLQFEEFEVLDELSPAQLAELMSVTDELKSLLKLDFSFYLLKDGVKTAISFENLMKLTDTNGASLFIEVYDHNGKLLLDLTLTGEDIGSDIIQDTGNIIQDSTNNTTKEPTKTTIKGAKMPNTAGNYMGAFLVGITLLGAAFLTYRKVGAVK